MPDKNITFHLKRESDIPTQTQSYYTVAIKVFGNKYRNKHNINQSQIIHITKVEIDMIITHESVHQSSGQTRSMISKRIDTSARQKNKYTS